MITELTSQNSQTIYGKTWCESCAKTLIVEEGNNNGMEALDQSAISLLLGVASYHERIHPKHKITVTIYERVPTLSEIRNGN